MEAPSLLEVIVSVLRSWETIAVTVAIVLYLFLVFYVARLYRKPRKQRLPKKIKTKPAPPPPGPETEEDELED